MRDSWKLESLIPSPDQLEKRLALCLPHAHPLILFSILTGKLSRPLTTYQSQWGVGIRKSSIGSSWLIASNRLTGITQNKLYSLRLDRK